MVTDVGMLVLGSKVSELMRKFCPSVVVTAAPAAALDWKKTSLPVPGMLVEAMAPALSVVQLFTFPFHTVSV